MRIIGTSSRKVAHAPESGESEYVAMTDMMVGVLFIFIIMLSVFALQYRHTTMNLTSAKDAQTAVLLKTANKLSDVPVTAQVDREAHIVCLPGSALGDTRDGDNRHCFAYSDQSQSAPDNAPEHAQQIAAADRAAMMSAIDTDMKSAAVQANVGIDNASLSFPIDSLFAPNSTDLTPQGHAAVEKVAQSLSRNLPCYAYGVAASGCSSGSHLANANIVSSTVGNVYTSEGQAAAALALRRSVAFHDALVSAQPTLGQIRNLPPEQPGSRPLLQVATVNQSSEQAADASQQILHIDFAMAPPTQ